MIDITARLIPGRYDFPYTLFTIEWEQFPVLPRIMKREHMGNQLRPTGARDSRIYAFTHLYATKEKIRKKTVPHLVPSIFLCKKYPKKSPNFALAGLPGGNFAFWRICLRSPPVSGLPDALAWHANLILRQGRRGEFILPGSTRSENFACGEYLSACRLQASLTRSAPKMRTQFRDKSRSGFCRADAKKDDHKCGRLFLAPATGIEPITTP